MKPWENGPTPLPKTNENRHAWAANHPFNPEILINSNHFIYFIFVEVFSELLISLKTMVNMPLV